MKSEVIGFNELLVKLAEKIAKAKGDGVDPVVAVGYTAAYAIYIHENTEMAWKGLSRDPRIRRIEQGGDPAKARPRPRKREPKGKFWDPQDRGQSKFLETPARREKQVMGTIVVNALTQGRSLGEALLLAGLHLQGQSQLLVPVDTGNLKASAFTRREK